MNKINMIIDNIPIIALKGESILEAAKRANIIIPTLCHHPDQKVKANCRICLVETSNGKLETACSTPVREGMNIKTNSKIVRDTQKGVLELILANHNQECLKCARNGNCELQKISEKFGISRENVSLIPDRDMKVDSLPMDLSNPSIVRDYSKCIKCNRCIEVCRDVQDASILAASYRSTDYVVAPAFLNTLDQTLCTYCGQCSTVCPVGAIYEKSDIDKVWEALDNPNLHVIVQIAPAVRVSIGEEFGESIGINNTGKIVSALRRMGYDKVFDTNFTADLTIIEEGHELIKRITENGKLPMITSCSPGWINYMEGFFPQVIDHVSTCKSPQQMFGALSKTYYSLKSGIHPSKIFTVSIMPCTAKKFEAQRPEMTTHGNVDVNAVLTTRELTKMIKQAGIDFVNLPQSKFDVPFGITTGAAAIFGATGGVMEAALRTVYEVVTKKELQNIDFYEVRGLEGIKESQVDLDGVIVKVAVAHGLKNARKLIEQVRDGTSPYHFIEIMSCPGGCIGGGGQPISKHGSNAKSDRIDGIYSIDSDMTIRKSHENPAIKSIYNDYLGLPNSHIAHEILHTHYYPR
jgi:iron-only hydrogenase group A